MCYLYLSAVCWHMIVRQAKIWFKLLQARYCSARVKPGMAGKLSCTQHHPVLAIKGPHLSTASLSLFVTHRIAAAAKVFQLKKCVGQSYTGHLLRNFGAQIYVLLSTAGRKRLHMCTHNTAGSSLQTQNALQNSSHDPHARHSI